MKKAILGILILSILTGCNEKNKKELSIKNGKRVNTTIVKRTNLEKLYSYSGTIEPYRTIPLTFQVSGTSGAASE